MTATTLLHELLDTTALEHPDSPAVSCGDTVMTYDWLRAASHRVAAWLADRGVRRGDRVLICLPADVHGPALVYGCSRLGAMFVITAEGAPAGLMEHLLDDAEPALLISEDAGSRRLAEERGIRTAVLADVRTAAATAGPEFRAAESPLSVDPVCLIYTSGSTGRPKAIVSTHGQVVFAARAIQQVLGYRADDVVFVPLPPSFDYGLYQLFLTTLAGARLHLASAAEAGTTLLRHLNATGATVLPAVPSLAGTLARLLRRPQARAPRIRLITNTGAAMPEDIPNTLRAKIPGLRIQLMYGLTECKRAAIMPPDGDLERPGSSGRALPGTEIFVVDETGQRLPAGKDGEIVVRGPHVMAGYWRRPEVTAQRFPRVEGLLPQLHTGDYGRLDEDGYLYFSGRRDDLYKERGFRVSVTEVEAAAHRLPEIEAAAVLPPAEGRDGAVLFAVTGLQAHDVLTGLRTELEDFKVPQKCVVVAELPYNASRKIDRAALARLLEESHV
ncbi:class I adenylate-forming enzyme family protein [Streptomyces sp. NPDC004788]